MNEHPAPESEKSVQPSSRKGDKRRRPRHGGAGLVLICTHVGETRGAAGLRRNLAVELRNLGWGGIQFVSTEKLLPSSPLSIQIKDPGSGELFHARGHVWWSDTQDAGDEKINLAGVQFDEIFTPQGTCARFFQGPEPPPSKRQSEQGMGTVRSRRRHERYPVEDYFVKVFRDAPIGTNAKPVNCAVQLVDFSIGGAQVICTDQLDPGTRVKFILRMGRFADPLQALAVVVWNQKTATQGWWAWTIGLQFKLIDRTAQKLLEFMITSLKADAAGSGPGE